MSHTSISYVLPAGFVFPSQPQLAIAQNEPFGVYSPFSRSRLAHLLAIQKDLMLRFPSITSSSLQMRLCLNEESSFVAFALQILLLILRWDLCLLRLDSVEVPLNSKKMFKI